MNVVTRNLAQVLAAVSAVFSLTAFAQHALVDNPGYSPTLNAASGSSVGQASPCKPNASVHATLGHGSIDEANAIATPPQNRFLDSNALSPTTVGTGGTTTITREIARALLVQDIPVRSGAATSLAVINKQIALQSNQSARGSRTCHSTPRSRPFAAYTTLNDTDSLGSFAVAITNVGRSLATVACLHGGSDGALTYSSTL